MRLRLPLAAVRSRYSVTEVAAKMGVSRSTIYRRLAEAERLLAEPALVCLGCGRRVAVSTRRRRYCTDACGRRYRHRAGNVQQAEAA